MTDWDDLNQLISEVDADPVARKAYQDQMEKDNLFQQMANLRGQRSQKTVADAMGTTQSAVSDLEHGRVDPRISTLQRYARAVGSQLRLHLSTAPAATGTQTADGGPVELSEPSLGVRNAVSVGDDFSLAAVLTTLTKEGYDDLHSPDELADRTGLPLATIGRTVNRLWHTGWIESGSATTSTAAGRFGLNKDRGRVIGVSLTRGWARGVLTDLRTADVLQRRDLRLTDSTPRTIIDVVALLVEQLGAQLNHEQELVGLGVALAGLIDGAAGTVHFAPDLQTPSARWNNVHLAAELQESIGLRTVVENDGNALAIYEYLLSQNEQDLAVVIMSESGEGIGGGLVINNEILRGNGGVSGELGHVIVDPAGKACRCGRGRGCLETVASVNAILAQIGEGRAASPRHLQDVEDLANAGDQTTTSVLRKAGGALGAVLAQLGAIVGPPRIVIFGPPELMVEQTFASARLFMSAVRARHDTGQFGVKVDITPKVLESTTVAQAAAAAAVHYFLASPRHWVPSIVPTLEPTPVPFVRVSRPSTLSRWKPAAAHALSTQSRG